jgi:lipopolysaccharide transport system permease protein
MCIENMKANNWTEVIESTRPLMSFNLAQVWRYRDLLYMFVRRDFVSQYRQTVLGPIWVLIPPIVTTIMFTIIFGRLANISTDSIPHVLFYMAGITCWTYFADCFSKTATTFRDNQAVFGKVYFPRVIAPLSIVVSGLIKFTIQFGLFIAIYMYFLFFTDAPIKPNYYILLFPLLVITMAILSLGLGMIITSFTTKYRDLIFLLNFGIQLMMYASPVIYPLSTISEDKQFLLVMNPMTAIIETFKYGFLGNATFSWGNLLYTITFSIVILFIGMVVFNRTEQNFMDTV